MSFHATKLFHTVEGGALICRDEEVARKISYLRNFGHDGPERFQGEGVNGKNSEFHAAMGVLNMRFVPELLAKRKAIAAAYDEILFSQDLPLKRPKILAGAQPNFAYYPVIFRDEESLLKVMEELRRGRIFPRRYFYPCLTSLAYIPRQVMPVAESVSARVLCLPSYYDLSIETVKEIASIVVRVLQGL